MSGFEAVQFRVGVNYKDARNPLTLSRDFRVVLTDGTGASASVLVSSVSQALFYPPGNSGPVPKVFLNTVRVPLGSFPALNLADIRSVRLAFNQSATGAVLVSDLAFATGSLGAIGPQPSLTIGDVPVTAEGDSGTKTFSFPVTLSAPIPQAVTVAFSTADGTATAPSDYTATSGTLTIPANTTTASIPVTVKGDTTFEKKETFTVNLSSPVNATIADGSGLGSIKNDDAKPSVTISDVSATEGNAGNKAFTFTVTLSVVSGANTVIPFATANGSAVAPGDYTAKTANLSIPAGSLTGTITIQVKGDTVLEGNETFFVNLSASFQATIADGQGQATIVNDD